MAESNPTADLVHDATDIKYQHAANLARYIRDHGQEADVLPDATIRATCDVRLADGTWITETTTLRPVLDDVRAWLGY